jgi:hypothetical protein
MKSFEDALRSALTRRDPPEGFADRVLAAASHRPPSLYRRWAAAAAVLILVLTGVIEHERRQRAEEQLAGEALIRAIEIANAKLDVARQRVVQSGDSHP